MGYGMIQLVNTEPVGVSKIKVAFMFHPGTVYDFRENTSIRLYYRVDGTSVNQSVDVTPQNADVYKKLPYMAGWYQVVYIITGLSSNTDYLIRLHLRLFKKPGSTKIMQPVAKSPVNGPALETTKEYSRVHSLFEIATYPNDLATGNAGDKKTKFVDFTRYIVAPSYDVNMTDVNEDWTDADYVTHRVVVREKVSGKFNIRFTSVEDYNNFMDTIYQNRQINGKGYTELKVQINNRLDYDTGNAVGVSGTSCIQYIGQFFVKIDSNPYAEPYYGRYDKYNDVSVSIEEA